MRRKQKRDLYRFNMMRQLYPTLRGYVCWMALDRAPLNRAEARAWEQGRMRFSFNFDRPPVVFDRRQRLLPCSFAPRWQRRFDKFVRDFDDKEAWQTHEQNLEARGPRKVA